MILIGDGRENVVPDQFVQPVCEHVARYLEINLKVVEAAYAKEGVTQYEESPSVPDDIDRLGDNTIEMVERFPCRHGLSLSASVA
jgi:hypothetical protein